MDPAASVARQLAGAHGQSAETETAEAVAGPDGGDAVTDDAVTGEAEAGRGAEEPAEGAPAISPEPAELVAADLQGLAPAAPAEAERADAPVKPAGAEAPSEAALLRRDRRAEGDGEADEDPEQPEQHEAAGAQAGPASIGVTP